MPDPLKLNIQRIIIVLFWLCHYPLYGQVPANKLGLNRPGIQWNYLENNHFKIIYPIGLDQHAFRVGSIIEYLSHQHDQGIGPKSLKTSIILHPETTIPNGFVTVGPFRSEFYTTPPQYFSTSDWLDLLAIHEFRHIKQFSNATSGLTKVGKNLLGSWTWGGMTGTALPRWFMEGDAVVSETALTQSGRGRLPSFEMEYKALALAQKKYGYEKASAGSLKEFVPDWYKLGYYLTINGSNQYGQKLWAKTVSDAIHYKGIFFPFSQSLKKNTGLNTRQFYDSTFKDLYREWNETTSADWPATLPHHDKKTVTDYYLPRYNATGNLFAVKRSYREWPHLIQLDTTGKEKKLTSLGITFDPLNGTLSNNDHIIVWSELFIDPRWHNRQFFDIVKYDLHKKSKKRITKGKRYFSPTLSPVFERIATIEINENQQATLVILNSTGTEIATYSTEDAYFLSFPTWINENEIVLVGNKNELSALLRVNLTTGIFIPITPFLPYPISHPTAYNDKVFFSAGYTTENNIYSIDLDNQEMKKITSHPVGAFQPTVDPNSGLLLYSGFTSSGYDLFPNKKIKEESFNPNIHSIPLTRINQLANEEGGSILNKITPLEIVPKKLNPISGLLNPHSILPYIQPPLGGIRILSDNIMSTFSAEVAGYYNFNEQLPILSGTFTYAGWYPEIRGNIASLYRRSNFATFTIPNDTTLNLDQYNQFWQETRVGGGLRLPLQRTGGSYDSRFLAEMNYHKIFVNPEKEEPSYLSRDTLTGSVSGVSRFRKYTFEPIQKDQLHSFQTRILIRHFKRMARQELGSNFGFHAEWNQRFGFGNTLSGASTLLRGDIYLPGIHKTHSLSFQTLYQRERYLNNYKYPNLFFYPRGYGVQLSEEIFKWSTNYAIPLWYPDIALGPVAFIQRISAHFFYDQAHARLNDPFTLNRRIQSTGVELIGDIRIFRLLDVRAGLRYSHALQPQFTINKKSHQFDFFILSISG
jgi:hypothetical protein